MSKRERRKGQSGEQEIARAYRGCGFTVRGLEGGGDHSIVADPETGVRIHSEVKRQETARPWAWWEQASTEAPPGTIPVVHFRRNRSPWLTMLGLDALLSLLCELRDARRSLMLVDLERIASVEETVCDACTLIVAGPVYGCPRERCPIITTRPES